MNDVCECAGYDGDDGARCTGWVVVAGHGLGLGGGDRGEEREGKMDVLRGGRVVGE